MNTNCELQGPSNCPMYMYCSNRHCENDMLATTMSQYQTTVSLMATAHDIRHVVAIGLIAILFIVNDLHKQWKTPKTSPVTCTFVSHQMHQCKPAEFPQIIYTTREENQSIAYSNTLTKTNTIVCSFTKTVQTKLLKCVIANYWIAECKWIDRYTLQLHAILKETNGLWNRRSRP